MDANRIQHFLFTNNRPTALSYRTPLLLSTVYHEGAEYPFLPELPLYVGKWEDEYPGGLNSAVYGDGSSKEKCKKAFEAVFLGYEKNLAGINAKLMKGYENTIDKYFDCLYNWAMELQEITGVALIIDLFIAVVEWLPSSGWISGLSYNQLMAKIQQLKQEIQVAILEQLKINRMHQEEIDNLKKLIKMVQGTMDRTKDPIQRFKYGQLINKYRQEIAQLQSWIKPLPTFSQFLLQRIKELWQLVKDSVFIWNGKFSVGAAISFIGEFGRAIVQIIGKVLRAAGTTLNYISVAMIINLTKGLVDCLLNICEYLDTVLKDSQAERLRAADSYYEQMEALLKGGCCKNYCCYSRNSPGGFEQEEPESSCSYATGFGLNLLLGNKYIPTFSDPKNFEDIDKDIIIGNGGNGAYSKQCVNNPWDLGCVPRPDCTKMGKINEWSDPPDEYVFNSWSICEYPGVKVEVDGDPPVMFTIPSHRCACGWDELPPNDTCSLENILESLTQMINSIPGIGTAVTIAGGIGIG